MTVAITEIKFLSATYASMSNILPQVQLHM